MDKIKNPTGKAKGTKSRVSRFRDASKAELIEFFKTQDTKVCPIWQIKTPCLLCKCSVLKGEVFRSSYSYVNKHVVHDKCLSSPVETANISLHPSISLTIS